MGINDQSTLIIATVNPRTNMNAVVDMDGRPSGAKAFPGEVPQINVLSESGTDLKDLRLYGRRESQQHHQPRPCCLQHHAQGWQRCGQVRHHRQQDRFLPGVGGQPITVKKADIAEMQASATFFMLPSFDQALSAQGMKDLMTYLLLPETSLKHCKK